jgi:hypothetical protein
MPAAPQIVQGGHLVTPVYYPIANATAVDYGDFLKISGGNATPLTASTDNETFIGQALEAKVASDGKTQIAVCPPTPGVVWEAELDTGTTIAIGDKLAWSADRVLTKTATDSLAVVVRPGTSQTFVRYELLKLAASGIKNLPGGTLLGDGFDLDEIGLGDDEDMLFGTGEDFGLRWSTGDASNHAAVLFVDDTNQALHITDKGARATDWNISAITDPAVYIHSNTTPATDYLRIGNHTGSAADIDLVGGATLNFKIDGTAAMAMTATSLTLADAFNVVANTTTGTKIGTAVGQKLGFWNATPIVQPSGAAQGALTDSSGGSGSTVPLVGNTMAGNEAANINNAHFAIVTLLHAMRTALVNAGIIKGGA